MNRTTNLFVFLIVISFILPATTIRYAQAASATPAESMENNATSPANMTENNANMTGESTQNNATTSANMTENQRPTPMENTSSPSASMENTASGMASNNTANARQESNSTGNATSTGAPENATSTGVPTNATSPSGSTASNNTLPYYNVNTTNAYCDSCNNDIYFHNPPMDLASMVLAVHNRERAAVGVPLLVWNQTAADHAKVWAEWNAKNGTLLHCVFVPESVHKDPQYIESCTHHEGENLAAGGDKMNTTKPIAQNMQGWIAEKNYYQGRPSATGTKVTGHYLQMISRDTKSVGCGTASGGPNDYRGWTIISCRYYPPGINVTGVGSGPIQ
jgi:uncharacterized protein YkwD